MAPSPLAIRVGAALGVEPKVAVNTVAEAFVDRLLADPRVSHFFKGTNKKAHIRHLSGFVTMAFGGSDKYTFSGEGVTNLTQAHAGMGITAEHFTIVAEHMQAVLQSVNLPEDLCNEAMAIVGGTKDEVLGTEVKA